METFVGHIKTPQDALIIFEACRRGQLQRVQRRLSSKERVHISSGSVFAWDESEAGMRRWTDGRTWSPSRVLGSFLTYRELNTKHRRRHISISDQITQYPRSSAGCSYKSNGLIKQSFSICTVNNQKIHLISYYTKADIGSGRLVQPSKHPQLSKIAIPKGYYPELNPLDTSGGHSATLHSMRTELTSSSDEDMSDLTDEMFKYPGLSIQDIFWGSLSCSEDKRQLKAIEGQLRI
ncbi:Gti1/Pac2 family-domain-containing protein [Phycomyces nitens]|nr:Gti1/Pac2 family-domain-containing protein [Phycomyces nitens]